MHAPLFGLFRIETQRTLLARWSCFALLWEILVVVSLGGSVRTRSVRTNTRDASHVENGARL